MVSGGGSGRGWRPCTKSLFRSRMVLRNCGARLELVMSRDVSGWPAKTTTPGETASTARAQSPLLPPDTGSYGWTRRRVTAKVHIFPVRDYNVGVAAAYETHTMPALEVRRCHVAIFDPDTIERFRSTDPRQAFLEVKSSIYRMGGVSSEDFLNAFDELVDAGVLSWEQIEEFERSR